jgi:hypothetical protein
MLACKASVTGSTPVRCPLYFLCTFSSFSLETKPVRPRVGRTAQSCLSLPWDRATQSPLVILHPLHLYGFPILREHIGIIARWPAYYRDRGSTSVSGRHSARSALMGSIICFMDASWYLQFYIIFCGNTSGIAPAAASPQRQQKRQRRSRSTIHAVFRVAWPTGRERAV